MKKSFVIILVFVLNTSLAQDMDPQKNNPDMQSVKTRALKVEFFSPLTGNLTVGYESYVSKGMSWESKLGIIGAGRNIDNQGGVFVKVGPKFKLTPDYIVDGMRSSHPLRGAYIRPELVMSYFTTEDTYDLFDNNKEKHGSISLLINYGKQFVLGEKITIDWSIGLGYGFYGDDEGYHYGLAAGGGDSPFAVSSGFTIGILL